MKFDHSGEISHIPARNQDQTRVLDILPASVRVEMGLAPRPAECVPHGRSGRSAWEMVR